MTVELKIPELGKMLGIPPLADYWPLDRQSSSEKAQRMLGWKPEHAQMLTEFGQRPA